MKQLYISKELSLPLDAVTHKTAILGMTGSGKSYCMTKLAELFLDARAQVVILDPKGEAWGLRLMADGKTPAYPIPVFGGDHGDMPLRPDMGCRLAELIVEGDYSAILDVSVFISSELAQFSYDFATRLFELKKRKPGAMSLMVDEAQDFMPQNPSEKGMEPKMLHAFERVAKQLRSKGVGMVICGQRPQEINKKILNMCEVWFAFQMTGQQERETMEKIFTVLDKNEAKHLKTLLPTLENGVAHIWSPRLLKVAAEFFIGEKKTFDSSSTPEVGARQVLPRKLAPVDAEAIETALSDIIEEEQANNPDALKKEKRDLQEQVRRLRAEMESESQREAKLVTSLERQVEIERGKTKTVTKTIEKPIVRDTQITRLEKIAGALGKRLDAVIEPLATMREFKVSLDGLLDKVRNLNGASPPSPVTERQPEIEIRPIVRPALPTPGPNTETTATNGEYDMADFEEFYRKTVQRLQQDGFAVTVKVEPREVVLKQFQQAEVERLLAQTRSLGDFAKQSLKWIESRGGRATKAEFLRVITGKDSAATSGSVKADRYKQIDDLVDAGLLGKDSNGFASNVGAEVSSRLASYNASPSDIEDVVGQVLLQLS